MREMHDTVLVTIPDPECEEGDCGVPGPSAGSELSRSVSKGQSSRQNGANWNCGPVAWAQEVVPSHAHLGLI